MYGKQRKKKISLSTFFWQPCKNGVAHGATLSLHISRITRFLCEFSFLIAILKNMTLASPCPPACFVVAESVENNDSEIKSTSRKRRKAGEGGERGCSICAHKTHSKSMNGMESHCHASDACKIGKNAELINKSLIIKLEGWKKGAEQSIFLSTQKSPCNTAGFTLARC